MSTETTPSIVAAADNPPSQPQQQPPSNPNPPNGGDTPQRPAYVPEKFWNAEKGAADVEKLGSAYVSLEQAFSKRSTLAAPLPGDPPEKVEAFRAELRKLTGAPDKPEGYEIKPPEKLPDGMTWDAEGVSKLTALAHKHALPPAAVQELLALQQERMGSLAANAMKSQEQQVQAQTKMLQDKWKDKFTDNVHAAIRAGKTLGFDLEGDVELNGNAKVFEIMHAASLMMREDKMLGSVEGSSKSNTEMMEEIRRSDAYNGKLGKDAQQAAAARMLKLAGIKA